MTYILRVPPSPSFVEKGLRGFEFGPLKNLDLDIHFIEVTRGHDTFFISKEITRIYYIIEGEGYFTIEGERYDVEPGILIEVPPNVEYSYSGTMKLLLIGYPHWFRGNEKVTRKNPDVYSGISVGTFLCKLGLMKKQPQK